MIKVRLFTASLYASTGVELRLQSYSSGGPGGIGTSIVAEL
jgi:hypothetical protein